MKNLWFAHLTSNKSKKVSREALSYYGLLDGETFSQKSDLGEKLTVNQAMKTLRNVKLMLDPKLMPALAMNK